MRSSPRTALASVSVRPACRPGVLLAYAVGLWGALHYLTASFGLRKVMGRYA